MIHLIVVGSLADFLLPFHFGEFPFYLLLSYTLKRFNHDRTF
jgi:hypothetical protein